VSDVTFICSCDESKVLKSFVEKNGSSERVQ
jgi:hypothetical protein